MAEELRQAKQQAFADAINELRALTQRPAAQVVLNGITPLYRARVSLSNLKYAMKNGAQNRAAQVECVEAVLHFLEVAEQATPEPVRPDIIERLTYHQFERDDLTLDECLDYLASGWKKVHGRTERQMVMQILALLAGQPATPEPVGEPVAYREKLTGRLCEPDDTHRRKFPMCYEPLIRPAPAAQAVPMAKEKAWESSLVTADWESVDAYMQGISDAEAHHGITAQAKRAGHG